MKAFLDTSVLVATFYADHEHHRASIALFLRFGQNDACCGVHSLAEVYAALTGMPPPRRVSGDQAKAFLESGTERSGSVEQASAGDQDRAARHRAADVIAG